MLIASFKGGKPCTDNAELYTYHEIRLDFIEQSKIEKHLGECELTPNTILTLRHASEGGLSKLSLKDRISILREYALRNNCLIDIEYKQYIQEKPDLSGLRYILSYHDFDNLNEEEVSAFLKEGALLDCTYLKLAIPIERYMQLSWLETMFKACPKQVLFAGLGKLGKLSRILYKHINARATYIGNGHEKVVPEQLTYEEIEQFRLRKITKNTVIGGLLGGQQVWGSIGLQYYNDYFEQEGFDAMYLPFSCDDFEDFWSWLNTFKKRNKFYGLSVTMPFKRAVREVTSSTKPVNLLHFERDAIITNNTDHFALKKALFILEKQDMSSILIYGSGAMAELSIQEASVFGSVFLRCRDRKKQNEICSKHSIEAGDLNRKYDLVINCTPLGVDETNLFQATGLTPPRMLIDLPYSVMNNSTNLTYHDFEHIIDGIQFWKWQALPQLATFVHSIKNR